VATVLYRKPLSKKTGTAAHICRFHAFHPKAVREHQEK
jgi:hypothetical protein